MSTPPLNRRGPRAGARLVFALALCLAGALARPDFAGARLGGEPGL